MSDDLHARLARTPAADLLPARRADEAARAVGPLHLVAHAHLGGDCRYLLVRDARGTAFGVPAVPEGDGLRRAAAGDGAAAALVSGLAGGLAHPLVAELLDDGMLRRDLPRSTHPLGEAAVTVDQTNDLVVVGDALMVKWLLHPAPGDQPGAVRARQLGHVDDVPHTHALVHLDSPDGRVLVATVSSAVRDAEDGWDWAVADVRGVATGAVDAAAALAPPARLGPMVAHLHAALAAHGTGRASAQDAAGWHARALRDLDDARLPEPTAAQVRAALAPLRACAGTPVIGIHGDLHIGQVLRTRGSGDLHVIDLDGSPLLTAEENLALQPAARDVAGMLASLDHVGRVVLHRTPGLTADQQQRVLAWIRDARAAFLDGYRAGLQRAGLAELLDEGLLHPLLVQQECREYAYAHRYLPHWAYVPDAALPPLLEEDTDGS